MRCVSLHIYFSLTNIPVKMFIWPICYAIHSVFYNFFSSQSGPIILPFAIN